MSFLNLFRKYKILIFVLYAICAVLIVSFIKVFWVNLLICLPLLALGVFVLIEIFPRRKTNYMTVVCADGLGTVQITSRAIAKSVCAATNAIDGVKYVSSDFGNEKTGLSIQLKIKIAYSKVIEISEVTRIFVKRVLEKEMNIRVAKIDVIVDSFVHDYKVNKVSPEPTVEEESKEEAELKAAMFEAGAPAYKLKYGEKEMTYVVPDSNVLKTREIQAPVRKAVADDRPIAAEQAEGTAEPSPEQLEIITERRIETVTEYKAPRALSTPGAISRPANIHTVSTPGSQSVSTPKSITVPREAQSTTAARTPKSAAATPSKDTTAPGTPKNAGVPDAHADIEEIALPLTAPPTTRAEQLQLKREEAARKYAELKAKQEQRKNGKQ